MLTGSIDWTWPSGHWWQSLLEVFGEPGLEHGAIPLLCHLLHCSLPPYDSYAREMKVWIRESCENQLVIKTRLTPLLSSRSDLFSREIEIVVCSETQDEICWWQERSFAYSTHHHTHSYRIITRAHSKFVPRLPVVVLPLALHNLRITSFQWTE